MIKVALVKDEWHVDMTVDDLDTRAAAIEILKDRGCSVFKRTGPTYTTTGDTVYHICGYVLADQ